VSRGLLADVGYSESAGRCWLLNSLGATKESVEAATSRRRGCANRTLNHQDGGVPEGNLKIGGAGVANADSID
jgi:hypothetical protein